MKKYLPLHEALIYYALVVLSFGFVWFYKIVHEKAILDAGNRPGVNA